MGRPHAEAGPPAVADARPAAAADGEQLLRGRSLLFSFTGLIPLILMVPILLLRLYAVGIIEGLVAGTAVIGYHLLRRQGITSLDALTVGFSALTATLYFGFDDRTIIENLDVVIYTLLVALLASSLLRRQPWTAQFAKRVTPAEWWDSPVFHTINIRTTTLWLAAFAVCDLLAWLASGPVRRFVPIALLIGTAMLVPRIVRWNRARLAT